MKSGARAGGRTAAAHGGEGWWGGDMMKSVHHVIDFTEVAHRRYWRDNGEQAPIPESGYEAAEHDGKSFVVMSNIDGPLAVYRIDFCTWDGLTAATDEEASTVSKLLGYVT
jgi:hypothetical protein